MIDIKQLTQDKAHLVELWKFLGLPEAMPDISLWQMDYGMDMIESGFKTLKKLINKGTDVRDVQKFLGKILHNSKLAKLTPEEYETYIAPNTGGRRGTGGGKDKQEEAKRSACGTGGSYGEREFADFCRPFAGICRNFAGRLPDG